MARPAFENYLAPWETKEGEQITAAEIKPDVLKKFLWNLLGDVDTAEEAAKTAKLTAKTLKDEKDAIAHKDDDELTKEKHRADKAEADLKAEREATAEKDAKAALDKVRSEVGTEKGLTEAQMGYLKGKNKAELETAADKYIEDNGLAKKGEDEQEDDDTGKVSERRPASQARTPGDPNPDAGKGSKPEDWATDYMGSQVVL